MKYLFLIIRHIWPRRRWQIVKEIKIYASKNMDVPRRIDYVQRDQFGNLRTIKGETASF